MTLKIYGMKDIPQLNEHNKEEYPPMHTTEHILNQTMIRLFGCGRAVSAHIEEALGRFDLRRLPDNASETVRVVKVGDYDECLCIGRHVENTSEIGVFKIISYDFKDGILRLRFKLL